MRLCDVNVLVYAHREDSPHHAFYRAWIEQELSAGKTFLYCEIVLSAFVRIVTHPKIFRPASPIGSALQFAADIRSAPPAVGIMPGARHWQIFADLCLATQAAGNAVPDAYLAALAVEAGAEWVSADAGFRVFEPRLQWQHLKPA